MCAIILAQSQSPIKGLSRPREVRMHSIAYVGVGICPHVVLPAAQCGDYSSTWDGVLQVQSLSIFYHY